MSARSPLGEFLRARRAVAVPDEDSLKLPGERRVKGLRREEVAQRAGVSVDYHVRLEQGREHNPSDQVLEALARALGLDEFARGHLRRIVAGDTSPPARAEVARLVQLMQRWTGVAAFVVDRNLDVVASTALAAQLSSGRLGPGCNLAVYVFSNALAREQPGWSDLAKNVAAALRFRSLPQDPRRAEVLESLADDLAFSDAWSRAEVGPLVSGTISLDLGDKRGQLVEFHALDVVAAPGYTVLMVRPVLGEAHRSFPHASQRR
ncbi:helix-turn-helix domain-containing protein [Branchiibius sp. NY16-3462-2]|uniref:helix-turn-helix domain-containing protein n=1 Tax=Branchiibius sp. NY16-3462-2 TaxID=1807500 RepID=UPI00079868F4|nr:helix-turn-helix domain-containing protein [Branchiibius sp. NY16-3462-2]KYH43661.1 hypothetical protein AZH51_02295 [Branchiibius sp. NY16-3462-2]